MGIIELLQFCSFVACSMLSPVQLIMDPPQPPAPLMLKHQHRPM